MALTKVSFGAAGIPGYEIGDKSLPAVILIQEWWGVTEIIKYQAEQLSKQGFRCLIPDLYKGKIGVDAEEASHLMNNLDFKNAVDELKQAVDYLQATGSPKVGATGFCMGGALAFCAAQHAGVAAAAPFYGTPNPAICQVEKITVPVEAHFGLLDAVQGFSDPATAKAHEEKMKAAGVPATFFFYDTAGHGFMNALVPDGPEALKKHGYPVPGDEELKTAFDRLVALFKKHLA
ncbi:hypothetical protein CHLRE_06g294000v5 [Chlamydomonas reinhardtii]|uniref:Dienelactone hydrolase domain-containing protein n=1 Tax=Chlamydomonas reinhardtii TaxID=3055 RepID=A0A2K3DQG5_CHLRE|nr:uncharacterized protein CHLRE_06g294000v5 [Chlamydomonas reinhardtii]PNW82784.1 hypothetical protein CHLRE_06g294000v5 [Chlamydomonas reinhardtii]